MFATRALAYAAAFSKSTRLTRFEPTKLKLPYYFFATLRKILTTFPDLHFAKLKFENSLTFH